MVKLTKRLAEIVRDMKTLKFIYDETFHVKVHFKDGDEEYMEIDFTTDSTYIELCRETIKSLNDEEYVVKEVYLHKSNMRSRAKFKLYKKKHII